MADFVAWLLAALALPLVGLPAIFLICLISATIIPLASEPAVFGYVKLNPEMFWFAMVFATAGNTAGGMIGWGTGVLTRRAAERVAARRLAPQGAAVADHPANSARTRWGDFVRRHGAPVLVLSWLPLIGSAMCVLAGWLRLPWHACMGWMALGKFVRFTVATAVLMWVPTGFWWSLSAPFRAMLNAW